MFYVGWIFPGSKQHQCSDTFFYQLIFLSVKSQEGFIKCQPIIIMNIYIDLLNQPAAWKLGEAGFAFLSQIVFLLSLYVWLLYNRFLHFM